MVGAVEWSWKIFSITAQHLKTSVAYTQLGIIIKMQGVILLLDVSQLLRERKGHTVKLNF